MATALNLWRNAMTAPLKELAQMQADMDNLVRDLMPNKANAPAEVAPACEVMEDKNAYVLRFDMPGLKKEDVKIELDGRQLTVTAERRAEEKADDRKTHYSEIRYGAHVRAFTLPATIDEKRVEAGFADGVLTVILPKIEGTQSRQIEIH